jgi:hypothetical protein
MNPMEDPRNPKGGWIKPKVDDVIITAARRGLELYEIAALAGCGETRVQEVLNRAFHHEMLNPQEAMRLGLMN